MSLDRRIKKGLQSPTIKVDLILVMVVVRDDHNKFISKCNHVRRYRNSHRPARYLSVFLVLSTRQLKISTPVLLFATGGLPAHVAVLERALRHELLRLGTTAVAAKVHIGSGSWITVGNDRPRLSRGAETEIVYSIEIVLSGIRLKECKDFSRELAKR